MSSKNQTDATTHRRAAEKQGEKKESVYTHFCCVCSTSFRSASKYLKYCSEECRSKNTLDNSRMLPIGQGSPMTLYRQRKRLGLIPAKQNYAFNEGFFFEWSDDLAWVLGLFWTDGHLNVNQFSICSTDLVMLETVAKLAQSNRLPEKRKSGNAWDVRFTSKRVADYLRRMGIDGNKTFSATFPEIPKQFQGAFVRGLIDGDGTISVRRSQSAGEYIVVSICGASKLLDGIQQWADSNEIEWLTYWIKSKESHHRPKWSILFNKSDSLLKMYELIYPSNRPFNCLERKFKKFDHWVKVVYPKNQEYKKRGDLNPLCSLCGNRLQRQGVRNNKQRFICKTCNKRSSISLDDLRKERSA